MTPRMVDPRFREVHEPMVTMWPEPIQFITWCRKCQMPIDPDLDVALGNGTSGRRVVCDDCRTKPYVRPSQTRDESPPKTLET